MMLVIFEKILIVILTTMVLAAPFFYLHVTKDVREVKKVILEMAKDPDSVRFYDVRKTTPVSVCGEFNAKNSFGAYAGRKRFISTIALGIYMPIIESDKDTHKELLKKLAC